MDIDLLTADFEAIVNRYSRNNGIWLSFGSQGLYQLPERLRPVFLSLGNLLLGTTTDRESALLLAQRFFPYDAHTVKRTEPVYMSVDGSPTIIDQRIVEYSKDEQLELHSRHFLDLAKLHFLAGISEEEGQLPTSLHKLSIEQLDEGEYPDEREVKPILRELAKRDGRRVDEVLAEIERRQRGIIPGAEERSTANAPLLSARPSRTRRSEPL